MVSALLVVLLAPKGPIAMHQTHLEVRQPSRLETKKAAPAKPDGGASVKDAKPAAKPEAPRAAKPEGSRVAKPAPKAEARPCLRYPVTVTRGVEQDTFSLTTCDGSVAPEAAERLSVLARPDIAQKPKAGPADLAKLGGEVLAPGVRRLDARLPHALQMVLDHFDKTGAARQVHIVSGYRPASEGSYHATAQALDLRIDGVPNEQIVSFCKTLPDTGCGYYPNSTFVHIDVRPPGTGHVAWIDASGPGESPRYVSAWPPPVDPFADDPSQPLDALPPLPSL